MPDLCELSAVLKPPYWRCVCGTVAMPLTDDTTCLCADIYLEGWTRVEASLPGSPAIPSPSDESAANRESGAALPEIPCCPPHEAMWRNGTTEPLDNCFVCIRNQRDELLSALKNAFMIARRQIRRSSGDSVAWMHVVRFCEDAGVHSSALRDEASLPNPQSPGAETEATNGLSVVIPESLRDMSPEQRKDFVARFNALSGEEAMELARKGRERK